MRHSRPGSGWSGWRHEPERWAYAWRSGDDRRVRLHVALSVWMIVRVLGLTQRSIGPPHAQGAHTRVLPRRHPTRTTQPPGNEEGGEHPNPAHLSRPPHRRAQQLHDIRRLDCASWDTVCATRHRCCHSHKTAGPERRHTQFAQRHRVLRKRRASCHAVVNSRSARSRFPT